MKKKHLAGLIIVSEFLATASLCPAEVMIFQQAKVGKMSGSTAPFLTVQATPVTGGKAMTLIIPNEGQSYREYSPNPAIVDLLKTLKPGDPIEVTHAKYKSNNMVRQLRAYKARPGETEPSAVVYESMEQKTVDGRSVVVVTVSKFGQQAQMLLADGKDDDGKMVPDPAMTQRLGILEAGKVILVEARKVGGKLTLVSFSSYIEPVAGEFVRLDVDKSTPEQAAVVVKADGQEKAIPMPTIQRGEKRVPDPRLLAKAKALTVGQKVVCRLSDETGAVVLSDIEAVRNSPGGHR